jgi:uncharacterized protein (TIGR02145 family)
VEFVKKEEGKADDYLHLLRNHSYNVLITSVTGEGYPTPGGAYNNSPANIEAEVVEWNDGEVTDIVFDGQHYLGVSPATFVLYGEASTGNRITVKTDVEAGWTIGEVTDSPLAGGAAVTWITGVSGFFSGAGNSDVVTFSTSGNNDARREGYIHVRAGRLDFAVKVTQHVAADGVGIWARDVADVQDVQELVFYSAAGKQPDALRFLLHWVPFDATVSASSAAAWGYPAFVYGAGSDTPGTTTSYDDPSGLGDRIFTIRPAAFTTGEIEATPFLERASTVSFTAARDGSTSAPVDVLLRHVNYNTVVDAEPIYALDGGEHSFTVRSNTAWVISDASGTLEMLQDDPPLLGLSGGGNTSPGETVAFKLASGNSTLVGGEVTLTLTDPTGWAGEVRVSIKAASCGTGGVALSRQTGNKAYLTHMYGDKCWMVQNSEEEDGVSARYFGDGGTISSYYTQYSGGRNGYYYDSSSFGSVGCPSGWHLPSASEIDVLRAAIVNDPTVGKWWTTSESFAGYRSNENMWMGFTRGGNWNINESNRVFSIDDSGTMSVTMTPANCLYSARCIENDHVD